VSAQWEEGPEHDRFRIDRGVTRYAIRGDRHALESDGRSSTPQSTKGRAFHHEIRPNRRNRCALLITSRINAPIQGEAGLVSERSGFIGMLLLCPAYLFQKLDPSAPDLGWRWSHPRRGKRIRQHDVRPRKLSRLSRPRTAGKAGQHSSRRAIIILALRGLPAGQVNGRGQTGGTPTYDEAVNHGCASHGSLSSKSILSNSLNLAFRSTDLLLDMQSLPSCSKQPTRTQPMVRDRAVATPKNPPSSVPAALAQLHGKRTRDR
jgi:hypothetical protein